MNIETLQEELSVRLRAAQAHSPTPVEGSESLKALNLLLQQRPVQARVAVPMLLAGVQAWAHGVTQIALAYATLGVPVDMRVVPPSPFVEKLLKKDEASGSGAKE